MGNCSYTVSRYFLFSLRLHRIRGTTLTPATAYRRLTTAVVGERKRRGGRAPYATKPDSRSVLFPSMDRECPVRSMPALPPKKTVHRNKKRLPFIAALQWLFLISSKMKSISHVDYLKAILWSQSLMPVILHTVFYFIGIWGTFAIKLTRRRTTLSILGLVVFVAYPSKKSFFAFSILPPPPPPQTEQGDKVAQKKREEKRSWQKPRKKTWQGGIMLWLWEGYLQILLVILISILCSFWHRCIKAKKFFLHSRK